ncbi:ATP-binding protein [Scytonema sp. PRP1]|uniref:ATP-binding protein n=1 Tax=Scytonema sp. PRP1 TaxID=3120513 RepID=UPI00300C0F26
MKSSFDCLEELLSNNHPIIACESPLQERHRLLVHIAAYCQKNSKNSYIWNLNESSIKELAVNVQGSLVLREFNDYQPVTKRNKEDYFQVLNFWKEYSGKGILILENIFYWIQEKTPKTTEFFLISEWMKSSLIHLIVNNEDSGKTTIILGPNADITSEIAALIPLWTQELPDTQEIVDNLSTSKILSSTYTDQDWLEIAKSSAGLYISDIISCLKDIKKTYHLENSYLENSKEIAKRMLSKKIQLLNRLYDIEFLPPPKVPLGGLELMQQSFKKFKRLLTPYAKQYNLRVPKGIMLVGPPGTGKSHSAKACSQNMGIPLIIVDWSNFRSFGNQAESKLKRLLRLADRLNQVILYFDDFDKGFAGDDDLAKRLASQLLTWMQERTSDVVVIASVNRMEWLPPELTRAGRFDYLFKVDLPNNGERHTIFKLHAARFDKRFHQGGDPWSEDEWRRILKATNRCVGAEIQTIVERAAATIFCDMTAEDTHTESELPSLELTIEALLEERRQIHPLAIREADRVESMRNKADQQALPSSPRDESKFAVGNIDIFS